MLHSYLDMSRIVTCLYVYDDSFKVDLLVDWHQEYSKTNGDREGNLIEIETFWKAHP